MKATGRIMSGLAKEEPEVIVMIKVTRDAAKLLKAGDVVELTIKDA